MSEAKEITPEQAAWDSYLHSIPSDSKPVALAVENKPGLPIMCLRWRGLTMRGQIISHLESILEAYGSKHDPNDRKQVCEIPMPDGTTLTVDAYAVQMAITLHHRIKVPEWTLTEWLLCGEMDSELWDSINRAMDKLDSPAQELDETKNASSADLSETKTDGAVSESDGKDEG